MYRCCLVVCLLMCLFCVVCCLIPDQAYRVIVLAESFNGDISRIYETCVICDLRELMFVLAEIRDLRDIADSSRKYNDVSRAQTCIMYYILYIHITYTIYIYIYMYNSVYSICNM